MGRTESPVPLAVWGDEEPGRVYVCVCVGGGVREGMDVEREEYERLEKRREGEGTIHK